MSFERRVHVWAHAFIPSKHPELPNYITKAENGLYVVEAPFLPPYTGTCFLTDGRDFDSSPTAPARTTVEFVLVLSAREMNVEKAEGRDFVRIGASHNVDCITGKDLRPPKAASPAGVDIGDVVKGTLSRAIFIRAATPNPFYTAGTIGGKDFGFSPDIDFSISINYNIGARVLTFAGSAGYFPAYELYYSIDGEAAVSLVRWPPYKDSTAVALFDFGTGINTQSFTEELEI
jgi:hypothetical protein